MTSHFNHHILYYILSRHITYFKKRHPLRCWIWSIRPLKWWQHACSYLFGCYLKSMFMYIYSIHIYVYVYIYIYMSRDLLFHLFGDEYIYIYNYIYINTKLYNTLQHSMILFRWFPQSRRVCQYPVKSIWNDSLPHNQKIMLHFFLRYSIWMYLESLGEFTGGYTIWWLKDIQCQNPREISHVKWGLTLLRHPQFSGKPRANPLGRGWEPPGQSGPPNIMALNCWLRSMIFWCEPGRYKVVPPVFVAVETTIKSIDHD